MIKMNILNTAEEYDELSSVEVLERRMNFSMDVIVQTYKYVSAFFFS